MMSSVAHPVLLDIDGTLVDSNEAHALAWAKAFRAYGYAFSAAEFQPLIGMGGDKVMATLVPGLAPDDGQLGEKVAQKRSEVFLAEYASKLKPTPGARDLLVALRERGCTLIVASSAKKDELAVLLRAARIEDLIEDAATSDDAEQSKPDPDIVLAALQKAGVSAAQAVMLGDTPYDILAAHAAGVRIVTVRCGGWREPELSDAEGVYDDPADVLAHLDRQPLSRLFASPAKT